jgi:predicted nucleic acid-binding protein
VYLDDDLVQRFDRKVGARGRSAYIERAVRQALDHKPDWDKLLSAIGSIADTGHGARTSRSGYMTSDRPIPVAWAESGDARVLLDSTVVIDLLTGRPATRERSIGLRAQGDVPVICAVVAEEDERPSTSRVRGGNRVLRKHTGRPDGAPRRTAGRALALFVRKRGITLSQSDCLIAATAATMGAHPATGDPKDFPMADVFLEHWSSGE